MNFPAPGLRPSCRAISTRYATWTLRSIGGFSAALALFLMVIASLASTTGSFMVDPDVYDALSASTDGWLYVMVVLEPPVVSDDTTQEQQIADRQQSVLDALGAGECDVVHRPETVLGLTLRVNESGLSKLGDYPAVRGVIVDVLNYGYAGLAPDACDETSGADKLFGKMSLRYPT